MPIERFTITPPSLEEALKFWIQILETECDEDTRQEGGTYVEARMICHAHHDKGENVNLQWCLKSRKFDQFSCRGGALSASPAKAQGD